MLLSFFSHALESIEDHIQETKHALAEKRKEKIDSLAELGTALAVKHPKRWRKFYRKNCPDKVDMAILNRLLADFYVRHHKDLGDG